MDEMMISTLEDRAGVLADNLRLGNYTRSEVVAIVGSFVKAFSQPEAALKLSKVALVVEDAQALITMTTDDVAKKMGAKDPTVRDLKTISSMLQNLLPNSQAPLVFVGVLEDGKTYKPSSWAEAKPLSAVESYLYASKLPPYQRP